MGIGRSENMRRIGSRNTGPELAVRMLLRELGFTGYRLYRNDLPGKPDLAWIGRRLAVFVHGCFWHGHDCAEGVRKPKSNQDYWLPKIRRNAQRDAENLAALHEADWNTLVIWECEITDKDSLSRKLQRFLSSKTPNKSFQRTRQRTARP